MSGEDTEKRCKSNAIAYGFSAAREKGSRAEIFQRAARTAFPQGSMKRVATPRTSARREEAVPCEAAKGGGRYTHTNPASHSTGG